MQQKQATLFLVVMLMQPVPLFDLCQFLSRSASCQGFGIACQRRQHHMCQTQADFLCFRRLATHVSKKKSIIHHACVAISVAACPVCLSWNSLVTQLRPEAYRSDISACLPHC